MIYPEQDSVIIPRLKPLTLHVARTQRKKALTKNASHRLFSYVRSVSLGEQTSHYNFVAHGELTCILKWDKEFLEYNPLKFTETKLSVFSMDDAERLECVYDAKGLVTKECDESITVCHALMLPPCANKLGKCFALLEITTFLDGTPSTRRIVSAKGREHPFWGSYATGYTDTKEDVLGFKPEYKFHQGGYQYSVLYIGDIPVCAVRYNNSTKSTLVSYEEFKKL